MSARKIIIIGGGASGLMAAGQAAENGAEVILMEKMKRPARKLCISGKGRCNITNIEGVSDFITHFGKTGKFLRQAFSRFFNTDLMDFFQEHGLEMVTERGGRVFPASGKAPDVLAVLLQWLKQCRVQINHQSIVDKLIIKNGHVNGVVANGQKIYSDAVILATGGASYPLTGSSGDGYRLAARAGHCIVPIRPALVPLETMGDVAGKMASLSLRNINVRVFINGKKYREAFGEMQFTKFGVTGPVILTISSSVVDAINNGGAVVIFIDLKPALDEKKLDARLLRDLASRGHEQAASFLRGLLPARMVPVCLELTNIPPDLIVSRISAEQRRRLRTWLKNFSLEIKGPRPMAEAIVTAGGLDTKEIDPRTMESRITGGLFIAGEVIDIHADTGGYNLQAAFSTGWLAGRYAASGGR